VREETAGSPQVITGAINRNPTAKARPTVVVKRPRGRPPKGSKKEEEPEVIKEVPARRGRARPPKATGTTTTDNKVSSGRAEKSAGKDSRQSTSSSSLEIRSIELDTFTLLVKTAGSRGKRAIKVRLTDAVKINDSTIAFKYENEEDLI
jgi:hypothetical protein